MAVIRVDTEAMSLADQSVPPGSDKISRVAETQNRLSAAMKQIKGARTVDVHCGTVAEGDVVRYFQESGNGFIAGLRQFVQRLFGGVSFGKCHTPKRVRGVECRCSGISR